MTTSRWPHRWYVTGRNLRQILKLLIDDFDRDDLELQIKMILDEFYGEKNKSPNQPEGA